MPPSRMMPLGCDPLCASTPGLPPGAMARMPAPLIARPTTPAPAPWLIPTTAPVASVGDVWMPRTPAPVMLCPRTPWPLALSPRTPGPPAPGSVTCVLIPQTPGASVLLWPTTGLSAAAGWLLASIPAATPSATAPPRASVARREATTSVLVSFAGLFPRVSLSMPLPIRKFAHPSRASYARQVLASLAQSVLKSVSLLAASVFAGGLGRHQSCRRGSGLPSFLVRSHPLVARARRHRPLRLRATPSTESVRTPQSSRAKRQEARCWSRSSRRPMDIW